MSDGHTGLLFEPGNVTDLSEKLGWAKAHPEEMATMGANALARFMEAFSSQANHDRLLEIYSEALQTPA